MDYTKCPVTVRVYNDVETIAREARQQTRVAQLIQENLEMLKRVYRTPAQRAEEAERLSLTHPGAYECARAREAVRSVLYNNWAALHEYLRHLACGNRETLRTLIRAFEL